MHWDEWHATAGRYEAALEAAWQQRGGTRPAAQDMHETIHLSKRKLGQQHDWSSSLSKQQEPPVSQKMAQLQTACNDLLATNHGADGNCTYTCKRLEEHYFPSPRSQHGKIRCFVYDASTGSWPDHLISQVLPRRDASVLLPKVIVSAQSFTSATFSLTEDHFEPSRNRNASQCVSILVRTNASTTKLAQPNFILTGTKQKIPRHFRSRSDSFSADHLTDAIQEHFACIFPDNYTLALDSKVGSSWAGMIEVHRTKTMCFLVL